MTEKLEILVVEDQPKHLADAKAVLNSRKQYGIEADYVSTLDDAKKNLGGKKYDGILSDVFFPEREGEEESACGLWIAAYVLKHNVPYVFVTSTYHHGRKTEPVRERLVEMGANLSLIDAQPNGCGTNNDSEAEKKNWRGALLSLVYFIEDSKERGWNDKWMFRAIDELNRGINKEFGGECSDYRGDGAPAVFKPENSYGEVYNRFDRVLRTYCKDLFS